MQLALKVPAIKEIPYINIWPVVDMVENCGNDHSANSFPQGSICGAQKSLKPKGGGLMKVAIISTGPTLDDPVGATPSESPFLLIVDAKTLEFESIPNPLVSKDKEAAQMLLSQLMQEHSAKVILAGAAGSRELSKLNKNGIRVLLGMTGSIRDTVEKFNRVQFSKKV